VAALAAVLAGCGADSAARDEAIALGRLEGTFLAGLYDWSELHKPNVDRAGAAFRHGYRRPTETMDRAVQAMRALTHAELHDGGVRREMERWLSAGSGYVRAVRHANRAVLAGDARAHRLAVLELNRATMVLAALSPPPGIEVVK
jgi:hypothetical protein